MEGERFLVPRYSQQLGRPFFRWVWVTVPPIVAPLSTGNATPVTNEARSEHSHTAASELAVKGRRSGRPVGWRRCGAGSSVRRPSCVSIMPVNVAPGQMALTLIPSLTYSRAAARVTPRMPCWAATYAGSPGLAEDPTVDSRRRRSPRRGPGPPSGRVRVSCTARCR